MGHRTAALGCVLLVLSSCFGSGGAPPEPAADASTMDGRADVDASVENDAGDAGSPSQGEGPIHAIPMQGGTGGTSGMMMLPTPLPVTPKPLPTMPVTGEGAPCSSDTDCDAGLRCGRLPDPFTGVCGRGCATAPDCLGGEICGQYSAADTGGLCITLVGPWKVFAYAELTSCQLDLVPVAIDATQNYPGGLCLELCLLEGGDPASLPASLPADSLVTCTGTDTCDGTILQVGGGAPVGACATSVARDEPCAVDQGRICMVADLCIPSDLKMPDGEQLCRQDCSAMSATCDSGTCTPLVIEGQEYGRYCAP